MVITRATANATTNDATKAAVEKLNNIYKIQNKTFKKMNKLVKRQDDKIKDIVTSITNHDFTVTAKVDIKIRITIE